MKIFITTLLLTFSLNSFAGNDNTSPADPELQCRAAISADLLGRGYRVDTLVKLRAVEGVCHGENCLPDTYKYYAYATSRRDGYDDLILNVAGPSRGRQAACDVTTIRVAR